MILSLDDLQRAARARLPKGIYGFVAGGAQDERSLRGNREAFEELWFRPRVLVDVSARSQATTLFGKSYASPAGIAPMGAAGMCWFEADLALARAATAARVPFILSGASTVPLERVIQHAPGAWYQAYIPAGHEKFGGLIDRVRNAGYEVLVVTADTAASANRENNMRNGISMPPRPNLQLAMDALVRPRWLVQTLGRTLARSGIPRFENFTAGRGWRMVSDAWPGRVAGRDALSWSDIAWIRREWKGPLVIKGILNVDDARRAREEGVDGIIVSNHGGRQLDSAVASLRALPGIADAVRGIEVMFDGGIRRGADVLKALALGAKFVFVGRPMMFGVAVAGEAGVRRALEILREEIDRDLALLGCTDVAAVNRSVLHGRE